MLELERRHGREIQPIVTDAIAANGSVDRAAAALGVNRKTFHGWLPRLRIQTRRVAEVEGHAPTVLAGHPSPRDD